jgi:NAD+-dependent farnesol dehydrogenase
MKYFITGANGFIGTALCQRLVLDGHRVVAFVRSPEKATHLSHQNIQLVKGSFENTELMMNSMQDCDGVFHLAAHAKPYNKNREISFKINVLGTEQLLKAALKMKIEKVVITSSAATIEPSHSIPSDEDTPRTTPYFNDYESTKSKAEELALEYSKKGLDVVMVNPSRLYGPGLMNPSNSVTKMIDGYCKGSWRIIPGNGNKIGNYVYIDDVVNGHILAMKYGKSGERYILGGDNVTFNEFFKHLENLTSTRRFMLKLPVFIMLGTSALMLATAKLTGTEAMITPAWIKKYLHDWELSSEKASRELSYQITPLEVGMQKTIDWLKTKNYESN